MPDPRYEHLQRLFEGSIALGEGERTRFLDAQCAGDTALRDEVESLLAHEPLAAAELASWRGRPRDLDSRDPQHLGPYTILGVLGEGGFGVVYRAERRSPMVQAVAIKLIKPGMDSRSVLRRFDQERQALAVLDHPNVARVLDAGMTAPEQGSRPYFVMEHVPGEPITAHCDRLRLTVRQRLELFIPVCEAVQHAHQRGIIHRDLKPGNILVAERDGVATPKVIDFGVAKAIETGSGPLVTFTEQGQVIGTPEYMSPEQAEIGARDIDTRTDIYSLGVVLYELLTGALPFSAEELRSMGFTEVQRLIREVDPPRPSTRVEQLESRETVAEARRSRPEELSRELRRELEWIPLRAMRKDREARYRSAAELADDVRNYLAGRPLLAGPESRAYRLRKFVRRRRGTVAAVAAVVLTLVGGTVVSSVFAIGQARARSGATQQQRRAEAIGSFLKEMLTAADPEKAKGEKLMVRDALDSAAKRIESGELAAQPLVEAELRTTIGATYQQLGLYPDATSHLRRAVALFERELGVGHVEALKVRTRLAEALNIASDYRGAAEAAEPAVAGLRAALGEDDPETLRAKLALGYVLGDVGRYSEGEALLESAVDGHRRTYGNDHTETANALNLLGDWYTYFGMSRRAEPLHREAWRIYSAARGPESGRALWSESLVGIAMLNQGLVAEALPHLTRAYEGRVRLLGPDHVRPLDHKMMVAVCLDRLGRTDEAEPILRECVAAYDRGQGRRSGHAINSRRFLGYTLKNLGRLPEAEQVLREALDDSLEAFGTEHYDTTGRVLAALSRVLADQHKDAEAEQIARQAFALRRLAPHREPITDLSTVVLREVLRRQGKLAEALEFERELTEILVAAASAPGATPNDANRAAWRLLTIEEPALRDPARALPLAERAAELTQHKDPGILDTLALACHETGDLVRAVEVQERAMGLLAPDARGRAEYQQRLDQFRESLKKATAEPPRSSPSR
ncbi:MAG: protein kinase domain-containing protein [Phycisphaerales bacterium]